MAKKKRRITVNKTGLNRIVGIPLHHAFIGYICLKCSNLNHVDVGFNLLTPTSAFKDESWKCFSCGFVHSKSSDLPFGNWPKPFRSHKSLQAERFWVGFFRICVEHKESYWKQCNTCGRILPFSAFSRHAGWGPLERQMECRSCKGAINAELNPKRTRQQLHESSTRRRIADLLLIDENEDVDVDDLFDRFNSRCFKTKKKLNKSKRKTWTIDHILPSKYLYPLNLENAALLSREANNSKSDRWPSDFYTNTELIELARLTGANLSLLAQTSPVTNQHIDVDSCVGKYLEVREHSNLSKRIMELKKLLEDYNLIDKLSEKNKALLGY